MTGQEPLPETLAEALQRLAAQLSPAEQARFQELMGEHDHDIRNSLGRIIGANTLLARIGGGIEGKDGETIREMTEIIQRAVKELDSQINQFILNLQ